MVQLCHNNFWKNKEHETLEETKSTKRHVQIHRIQKFQTEPIYTKKYEQIFPIQNYFALD